MIRSEERWRLEQQEAVQREAPKPADARPEAKPERRGGRILSRLPFRPSEPSDPGSFNALLKVIKNRNSKADTRQVQRAYAFAEEAHRGQQRLTGEAFIEHPVAVATILA